MLSRTRVIGASIGLSSAAMLALGNVLGADRHLVSMPPDILSILLVPGVVAFVLYRFRARGSGVTELQVAGTRIARAAAAAFSIAIGVFALLWLPRPSLDQAGLSSAVAHVGMAAAGGYVWTLGLATLASWLARRGAPQGPGEPDPPIDPGVPAVAGR